MKIQRNKKCLNSSERSESQRARTKIHARFYFVSCCLFCAQLRAKARCISVVTIPFASFTFSFFFLEDVFFCFRVFSHFVFKRDLMSTRR
jgi:hypothetical protein